ncbi:thioesterase family protein [Brevibacterium samyangense]|uniref:Thioesterase family protein n=1 Tax=Brevibacterium samyangense TaxID=366888 RepID=A0ABP5F2D3_9MICO
MTPVTPDAYFCATDSDGVGAVGPEVGAVGAATDSREFRPTRHVGGAWTLDEQHIGPILGLLTHLVDEDRETRHGRGAAVVPTRLSVDILGVLTMEPFTTRVRVVRPGRTVELAEAVATQNGRDAVVLRVWHMASRDTRAWEGTPVAPLGVPEEFPEFDPRMVWPGGFIESVETRRVQEAPGRGAYWVRTPYALLDGVRVSTLARMMGLVDIANGMVVRRSPEEVMFPNVDLTVHLFRQPGEAGGDGGGGARDAGFDGDGDGVGAADGDGDGVAEGPSPWFGFDTSVSFGPGGVGLTSSVLHDAHGPLGTMGQSLTVRPR